MAQTFLVASDVTRMMEVLSHLDVRGKGAWMRVEIVDGWDYLVLTDPESKRSWVILDDRGDDDEPEVSESCDHVGTGYTIVQSAGVENIACAACEVAL